MTDNQAPVALFVYNRPWHTRQTLEALQRNQHASATELIVFCDGAKSEAARGGVEEVRTIVREFSGMRSVRVIEREKNFGLANSIISGVTSVCAEYGRAIVMEDDLVTSAWFLEYMNDALARYADDARVGSIHGYWYPVGAPMPETFFMRGASCWGWATWSRAWGEFEPDGRRLLAELNARGLGRLFDLDGAMPYMKMLQDQINGRNDSWAIRWHAAMFLAGRLQLSPGHSLVRNVGFDGTGVHCVQSTAFDVETVTRPIVVGAIPVEESAAARTALIQYYRGSRRGLPTRIMGRLRRMLA